MSFLAEAATALAIIVLVVMVAVFGPVTIFHAVNFVGTRGSLLAARRRLRLGTGSWDDLTTYLIHAWDNTGAPDGRWSRIASYLDSAEYAAQDGNKTWRPALPPVMFRWLEAGFTADFMFDALDAGYDETVLAAHLDGHATLNYPAVRTLLALRASIAPAA
jgi:hypothetical protein